jgi:hypothetical protein
LPSRFGGEKPGVTTEPKQALLFHNPLIEKHLTATRSTLAPDLLYFPSHREMRIFEKSEVKKTPPSGGVPARQS